MTDTTAYPPPYHLFQSFEAEFRARFAALEAGYPFAMMVIEKDLRNAVAGYGEIAASNVRSAGRGHFAKAIGLALARLVPSRPPPGYYLKLSGLPTITNAARTILAGRGLAPLGDRRVLGFSQTRRLHTLATNGPAYYRFFRRAAETGILAAIEDARLVAALDRQIRGNLAAVVDFLRREDVRLILSDGDCTTFQRVIVAAARKLGVPFITVAHGYIQNRFLLTIAPIWGDALITWTDTERADLASVLPPDQARKVHCFGYPKEQRPRQPDRAAETLVVWDPITPKPANESARSLDDLLDLCTLLRRQGHVLRLRLHPKDRAHTGLAARLAEAGLPVSAAPLGQDLDQARLVVGALSSVLFEAVAVGIPSIEIREYDYRFRIPGTLSLSLRDPEFAARARTWAAIPPEPVRPFDAPGFAAFLDGLGRGASGTRADAGAGNPP